MTIAGSMPRSLRHDLHATQIVLAELAIVACANRNLESTGNESIWFHSLINAL